MGYLDFPVLGHGKTPSAKATIVETYLMMQFMIKQLNLASSFRERSGGTAGAGRETRINNAADEQGNVDGRNVAVITGWRVNPCASQTTCER
jgi:hypothetical protein